MRWGRMMKEGGVQGRFELTPMSCCLKSTPYRHTHLHTFNLKHNANMRYVMLKNATEELRGIKKKHWAFSRQETQTVNDSKQASERKKNMHSYVHTHTHTCTLRVVLKCPGTFPLKLMTIRSQSKCLHLFTPVRLLLSPPPGVHLWGTAPVEFVVVSTITTTSDK